MTKNNEKLKILIVEDDALIAEDIWIMLEDLGMQPIGKAHQAKQVINKIQQSNPDIILLDINLNSDQDGIELGETINRDHKIPFIYLTSYFDNETVERAKKTNPAAFVLKPFDKNSLRVNIQLAAEAAQKTNTSTFFVKSETGLTAIDPSDICFINAEDNCCFIYMSNRKFTVHKTLKNLKEIFVKDGFMQVHRSYLINFKKITNIFEDHIYIEEYKIPIGKTYRASFHKSLNVM